jgi:hypothetical protein
MKLILEHWRKYLTENKEVFFVDVNLLLPTEELGYGKPHTCPGQECEAAIQDKMAAIQNGHLKPIEVCNEKPVKTYRVQDLDIDQADKSEIPEPFYHVMDGHHRLEAAKRLGLLKMPVYLTPEENK